MLKGIPITLYETVRTGTDPLNRPVYEEIPVQVENVLVMPTTTEEQIDDLNLNGVRVLYTLAIPKGDTHDWQDKKVSFFDQSFKTVGAPVKTIDALTPTAWNTKVKVARYE